MELVGSHDAVDLVPLTVGVEAGEAGPEAGDLQHHLGAVAEQELGVFGRLVVPPDVVEDGRVDVPLVVAEIPVPPPRPGVEVHDLGLFLAVATALPRVHGSPVAGFFSRRTGLVQPPVAIHEQLARDLGQPEVEERVDVEFVPEDVPAVSLAVEAAGWDPGVQVGRVWRADLKYVRNVQADQKLNPVVFGDAHVADRPQLAPGSGVTFEGLGERLVYGMVARGVQGDHLLDAHGSFLLDLKSQYLVDVILHLVDAAVHTDHLVLPIDPGSGGLGNIYVRLAGLHPERDDVGTHRAGQLRLQVPAFELPVAGDAPLRNPA